MAKIWHFILKFNFDDKFAIEACAKTITIFSNTNLNMTVRQHGNVL